MFPSAKQDVSMVHIFLPSDTYYDNREYVPLHFIYQAVSF